MTHTKKQVATDPKRDRLIQPVIKYNYSQNREKELVLGWLLIIGCALLLLSTF